MPEYRRHLVAGGTFFFTVNLLDRRADLLVAPSSSPPPRRPLLVAHVDLLRDAVRQTRLRAPFEIDAWMVLPDHMHCLWTLPSGDADFPSRWRAIKTAFSKALPGVGGPTGVMARRGERGIWQRRYSEHTIRDAHDYAVHMDYTHFSPVKHGYVSHPADWPYSSPRRCLAAGVYPSGWSGGGAEPDETGERR